MPISKDKVIAELNARQIGYSDEMEYPELVELLDRAKAAEKPPEEAKVELPIDYADVFCGLRTIHDLHRRITIIERKLGL